MNTQQAQITAAIIGAAATIIVAVLGKVPIESLISAWSRKRANIPEIMASQWKAEWQYDDGGPAVADIVTFESWTKNSKFKGHGEVTHGDKIYRYSITGEVSPTRLVVLTYKAEKFPTEANFGTAAMLLSGDPRELTGSWSGLEYVTATQAYRIRGGKLTMKRVR
jgi:hypothetical protein